MWNRHATGFYSCLAPLRFFLKLFSHKRPDTYLATHFQARCPLVLISKHPVKICFKIFLWVIEKSFDNVAKLMGHVYPSGTGFLQLWVLMHAPRCVSPVPLSQGDESLPDGIIYRVRWNRPQHGLWCSPAWIWIPALPLTSFVTLGNFSNLSGASSPPSETWAYTLQWGLILLEHERHWERSLTHYLKTVGGRYRPDPSEPRDRSGASPGGRSSQGHEMSHVSWGLSFSPWKGRDRVACETLCNCRWNMGRGCRVLLQLRDCNLCRVGRWRLAGHLLP